MSKRDVISRGSSEAAYAGKLSAAAPGPPGFSTRLPIRRRGSVATLRATARSIMGPRGRR